ncbi:YbhN family protein [candidate division CSSED10-310 bacterium]|uniref:YbhN family protein n=1 Tax=candidate division CSSED10-310 bacterium TaxID=2855610 RepID=A0ABV6YYX5_UNCC1
MDEQIEKESPLIGSFRWLQTLLFGLVIIIILIALSDLDNLIMIFMNVKGLYVFLAALATFLSYLFITLSYRRIFNIVRHHINFAELMTVTVISTLINYYLATGGASGYALRAILLKKRDIPVTTTFSVSLLQGVLTNVTVMLLFLISLISYVFYHSLTYIQSLILILPVLILSIYIFFILLVCFNKPSSEQLSRLIVRVLARLEKYRKNKEKSWQQGFLNVKGQFYEATALFRQKKQKFWVPAIQVLFDWIFAMVCLHFCFVAVDFPLNWMIVACVYFVGIFISFVFVATGGLGVMEGGMTAVFTEFGVPWETALAAVLIYRFIYYILPLLLILPSYVSFVRSPHLVSKPGAFASDHK